MGRKIEPKEIARIKQLDPDSGNDIELIILKEEGGGMFAVETDYLLNTDEPIYSVYSKTEINTDNL